MCITAVRNLVLSLIADVTYEILHFFQISHNLLKGIQIVPIYQISSGCFRFEKVCGGKSRSQISLKIYIQFLLESIDKWLQIDRKT